MDATTEPLNWLAVFVGTIVAYGLGMLWFSPKMFGKPWSGGMKDLQPPATAPVLAMLVQLVGVFLLALVIGITATQNALFTAILAILAAATLISGNGLFKQNAVATVLVDAGYIVTAGALMIAAQGIF